VTWKDDWAGKAATAAPESQFVPFAKMGKVVIENIQGMCILKVILRLCPFDSLTCS